jgi:hypothetical protein
LPSGSSNFRFSGGTAGGQEKPISLYFLAIAQSGERKTATDALSQRPIEQRAGELQEIYDADLTNYRNAFDVWTTERSNILKDKKLNAQGCKHELDALGSEPKAPRTPIILLSEPTTEGLTRHLKTGYPSVGLCSSEGGQFIGGHAMSDDAKRRSSEAPHSRNIGPATAATFAGSGSGMFSPCFESVAEVASVAAPPLNFRFFLGSNF